MHPLLRISFRLAVIFAIGIFLIQPFNWYCQITQSCRPFSFAYYMPKREGTVPVNVVLETQNYREGLEFTSIEHSLTTVAHRKNTATYRAKNLTKRPLRFRLNFYTNSEFFEKNITRFQCPCFHEYKLKGGEVLELKAEFEVGFGKNEDQLFDELAKVNNLVTFGFRAK